VDVSFALIELETGAKLENLELETLKLETDN
jgi:hypothetical protein